MRLVKRRYDFSSYNSGIMQRLRDKQLQKKIAVFVLFFMIFQVLSPVASVLKKYTAKAAVTSLCPTTKDPAIYACTSDDTYMQYFTLISSEGQLSVGYNIVTGVHASKVEFKKIKKDDGTVIGAFGTAKTISTDVDLIYSQKVAATNDVEVTVKAYITFSDGKAQFISNALSMTPKNIANPTGVVAIDSTPVHDLTTGDTIATASLNAGVILKYDVPTDKRIEKYTLYRKESAFSSVYSPAEAASNGGTAIVSNASLISSGVVMDTDVQYKPYITNTSATVGKHYYYALFFLDHYGKVSYNVNANTTTHSDGSAPAVATGVTATAGADGTSAIISYTLPTGLDVYGANLWLKDTTAGTYTYKTYKTGLGGSTGSFVVTGLDPETDYTYAVTAFDYSRNFSTKTDVAFKTNIAATTDTTAPTISEISAGSIGADKATITWSTDELADSQVVFGEDTNYGTTEPTAPADTDPRVAEHSVILTGLTAGTTYHYKVISIDASANSSTSADKTFKTTAADGTVVSYDVSVSYDEIMGAVSGDGSFDAGGDTTLEATPNDGYRFTSWGGACSGTSPSFVISNIQADKSCTAIFTATTSSGNFDITPTNKVVTINGVTVDFGETSPSNMGSGFDILITSSLASSHTAPTGSQVVRSYDISPTVTLEGSYSANITLNYPTGSTYTDGDTVRYWDGSGWSTSGISNISSGSVGTISFTTTHFSEYAILTAATTTTTTDTTTDTLGTSDGTTNTEGLLPEAGLSALNLFVNILLAACCYLIFVKVVKRTKYFYILG